MRTSTSSHLYSLKLAATSLLLSLLLACSTTPDEMELLDKSFMLYEHALRWQDYDLVIGFHIPEHETLTEQKRKQLKKYRVTGYNVVYSRVDPEKMKAKQIIEITYYNDEYAVVRDLTVTYNWQYNEKNTRWEINNPLPDFK